ncbi:MAG: hypothetical protein QXV32_05520 [Conexivisphaerales archaeon]
MYDLPNEPSKIRVRAWRIFKKLGAVYPSVSICIVSDNKNADSIISQVKKEFGNLGTIIAFKARCKTEDDLRKLIHVFEDDRSKQLDEIYEECQEFLTEVNQNMESGNVTPEETDELEEGLESLERWYKNVLGQGMTRKEDADKVEKKLLECRAMLAQFAERAEPEKVNR